MIHGITYPNLDNIIRYRDHVVLNLISSGTIVRLSVELVVSFPDELLTDEQVDRVDWRFLFFDNGPNGFRFKSTSATILSTSRAVPRNFQSGNRDICVRQQLSKSRADQSLWSKPGCRSRMQLHQPSRSPELAPHGRRRARMRRF